MTSSMEDREAGARERAADGLRKLGPDAHLHVLLVGDRAFFLGAHVNAPPLGRFTPPIGMTNLTGPVCRLACPDKLDEVCLGMRLGRGARHAEAHTAAHKALAVAFGGEEYRLTLHSL